MPQKRSRGILGECDRMHAAMQTSDVSILSPKRQRVISGDEMGQRVGNGTEKDIVDCKYLKAGDANAAIEKLKKQDESTRKPGDKRRRWDVMHKNNPGGGRRYQIIELPPSDLLNNDVTVDDAVGSEDESLKTGGSSVLTGDARTAPVDASLMAVVSTTGDHKPVETADSELTSGEEDGVPNSFIEALEHINVHYSRAKWADDW